MRARRHGVCWATLGALLSSAVPVTATAQPAAPDAHAEPTNAGPAPAPTEDEDTPAPADSVAPPDPSVARVEARIDPRLLRHVPTASPYDQAGHGVAPGVTHDGFGLTADGASAIEDRWVLDGFDLTAPLFGGPALRVPLDLAGELTVLTAGHGAALPGAAGATFGVATRRGGDALHGSVFAYVTPGALVAARAPTPSQVSSIEARRELSLALDVGAELGGPIVPDRAWFWVGVAPRLARTALTRLTQRRTDVDQDGVSDVDAAGDLVHEVIDRASHTETDDGITALARLDVAPAPGHQGGVTLALATGGRSGLVVHGHPGEQAWDQGADAALAGARWISRLGALTEVRAAASMLRTRQAYGSADGARDDVRQQAVVGGGLAQWTLLGGESEATRAGCTDGPLDDDYPLIANCPDDGRPYYVGGPGALGDDRQRRATAAATVTHRLDAVGAHALELGAAVDATSYDHLAAYSGGAYLTNYGDRIYALRTVRLRPADVTAGDFPDTCTDWTSGATYACNLLDADDPAARLRGDSARRALHARDTWRPWPGLALDLGVRYEAQRMRHGEGRRGHVEPLTGRALGDDALAFDGLWAPRLGLELDPAADGRVRLHAGFERVHAELPLHLAVRAFGDRVTRADRFGGAQCGAAVDGFGGPDGNTCLDADVGDPELGTTLSGYAQPVAADVRPPYVDEWWLGVDRELAPALVVGATYRHVRLGRVLEDALAGDAFVLGNPGDPAAGDAFGALARARRDHDTVELTLRHQAGDDTLVVASYAWARTRGDYPGLIAYDSGQVDPHVSSQYDLPELVTNRDGPLPQDRPHTVKLEAFHAVTAAGGAATLGARGRYASGTPVDALGPHPTYGDGEAFVLPRGAMGRTPAAWTLDLHAAYRRDLGGGVAVELFVDLLNTTDHQPATAVDERYTRFSTTAPISGGGYEDLIWAKERTDTGESSAPVIRSRDFRQPTARLAPRTARLGLRLTF